MASENGLNALVQQAEQLTADITEASGELPHVHRNLYQIHEAGQRLLEKTAGVRDGKADVKAAILLGSRGFDVPKLSQKLESLNAAKSLEAIEPVWETDIEGFLSNERENTLLAAIEQSRKNTFAEAERSQWLCCEREWEEEKEMILNSLVGTGQELELTRDSEVYRGSPLSMHGRSGLDAVAMAYAREVFVRNEAKLQGLTHSLITTFHQASIAFPNKSVHDCWSLVKALVDIPSLPPAAHTLRSSPSLQLPLLSQARHHLEHRYLEYIRESVHQSLAQAQLGGVPGTFQLVRSFLHLRQASSIPGLEDGCVEGQPVWALAFYCLRCGDRDCALATISRAQSCVEFCGYLREYVQSQDLRLSHSSETRLRLLYKRTVRTSTDPYKRAVYCLVGRCEVADSHPDVCSKTEDYMWFKLSQVSCEAPDSGHAPSVDDLTLSQLQATLLEEFGETYFNASQVPMLYVTVLLLSQQFEAAIEFLSRIEHFQSHAVHFAIGLQELGLLRLTESPRSRLLVRDSGGVHRLNYARLVISYTRRFSQTDPREALQYFFLLKGMEGRDGHDVFSLCVAELVMESREFALILGRLLPDGSRRPGAVDKFLRDTSELTAFVAAQAEAQGLYEDAVRLYDLCKDHEKVLTLLNQLLSSVASSPPSPQSQRDRLQQLAVALADRYKGCGHSAPHSLAHIFFVLLDIMTFFDHYHHKREDQALEVHCNSVYCLLYVHNTC
ncbi:Nuclear pore complex protein Nup93 [Geodia barretti]|uniref:Nuclear pore protein n=1 Tax=Geodia barretti TaxID=519541 RepID=A0AA35SSA1_GEOBA|nr:Nuclear pore complex protein Nup93 [Geodia barretti]